MLPNSDIPLSGSARLKFAILTRPMATICSLGSTLVGTFGLILGANSSRAFTLIHGGTLIAHGYGACLTLGGILFLVATVRSDSFLEILASLLLSAGYFLYGGGVFLGLGLNGLIAGTISLLFTVGLAARVRALLRFAKALQR